MTFAVITSPFSQKVARALARGLIGLMILSHALLAFSSVTSPSHDSLTTTIHAHTLSDAGMDWDGHGHKHEDFEDADGAHQHGHNPADHSHDKPNLPPTYAVRLTALSNQWIADEHRLVYPAPCACLERPPKHLSIA